MFGGGGELGLHLESVVSLAEHNPPNEEVAVVLERMATTTRSRLERRAEPLERSRQPTAQQNYAEVPYVPACQRCTYNIGGGGLFYFRNHCQVMWIHIQCMVNSKVGHR